MKKTILIGVLIITLLVISGCGQQQITCNKPYILVGTECCLDQNDNSICDRDEISQEGEGILRSCPYECCDDFKGFLDRPCSSGEICCPSGVCASSFDDCLT